MSEIIKRKFAEGVKPELYYWRSQSGIEVDLIVPENGGFVPYEIKLSSNIKPQFYKNIQYWLELTKSQKGGGVISNCSIDVPMPGNIRNIYWKAL